MGQNLLRSSWVYSNVFRIPPLVTGAEYGAYDIVLLHLSGVCICCFDLRDTYGGERRYSASCEACDLFVQCKHLLATRLAEQLGRCLARPLGRDDLAAMVQRQNHNHI